MSASQVAVKRHMRRRTGKTAKVAQILGLSPYIEVEPFRRRHPEKRQTRGLCPTCGRLEKGHYPGPGCEPDTARDAEARSIAEDAGEPCIEHDHWRPCPDCPEKDYDAARRKARVAFLSLEATR